jgi:tRNA threonylcarbamoyladenosine biosynthesis protein TsaB
MPDGFRHWSPLPPGVGRVPYGVAAMLRPAGDADLFRECVEPDAFLHAEPSYAEWTPAIHRAPGAAAGQAVKNLQVP